MRAGALQPRRLPNRTLRLRGGLGGDVRGLALAYAGRAAEAIASAERGVALLPSSKDAETGGYLVHQLARYTW